MSRRLYVGNLNFDMNDLALRQIFARVGGVEHAELIKDRLTGLSRGFGFIDMMTAEDAETAIGELDGVEVMGRTLRVALAKARDRHRSREQSAGSGITLR